MLKPQCQNLCARYYGWIALANSGFNGTLKIIVGSMAHSQALIADGFRSLTDVITAIMTRVSLRISRWPKDERHPYGHGKIAFLTSTLFGCLFLAVALGMAVRAVSSIVKDNLTPPIFVSAGPAVISILCSVALARYAACVSRHVHGPAVAAGAKEHVVDALSSAATLAGIIGALIGYPFLDPAAAVVVALLIARTGARILKDGANGLMDGSVAEGERDRMARCAASTPGVLRVAHLKTRQIGQGVWADAKIIVPAAMTLRQADRVAREVRNALMRNFPRIQDAVVYLEGQAPAPTAKRPLWHGIVSWVSRRFLSLGESRTTDES